MHIKMDEIYVEKEKVVIKEQKVIKCASCEKDLVNITIPDLQSQECSFSFSCPYCFGTSFKNKLPIKILVEPIKNVFIKDSTYSKESNSNIVTLGIKNG